MIFSNYNIKRATVDSAGYDFKIPDDLTIHPGEKVKINTGVRFDGNECVTTGIHNGDGYMCGKVDKWFMAVFPRSSLGMKYGMRFTNTVGIIDMDYRNDIILEVMVDSECQLKKGERIAQGIVLPFCVFKEEEKPTESRTGGMGSTGRF